MVIYAWAVFAFVSLSQRRVVLGPVILLILGSLPVIDHAQLLFVAFLMAGLLTALVWTRLPKGNLGQVLTAALRLPGRSTSQAARQFFPRF